MKVASETRGGQRRREKNKIEKVQAVQLYIDSKFWTLLVVRRRSFVTDNESRHGVYSQP